MYLIKNIYFDSRTKNVIVEDGIRVTHCKGINQLFVYNQYWGKTKVYLGEFADFSRFPIIDEEALLLPYINEYSVKNMADHFKELLFNVSTFQPENIEGYIVFVKHGLEMKTDGEKLFGRYCDELVVVLRDNNYLEFDGKKIEVINNHLMLYI